MKKCSVAGCNSSGGLRKGMCDKHYSAEWIKSNPLKKKQYQATYRARNREKIKMYEEEYRSRPEVKERRKKQKQTPKYRYQDLIYSAKVRGLELTITFEQFRKFCTFDCIYCGRNLVTSGYGLDRLDNNRGYHLDNVAPCCAKCNDARGDRFTADEWYELLKTLARVRQLPLKKVWD